MPATYGAVSPPREDLLRHLASQASHVDSLQTLRRKLERNTFAPVVCSILGVVVFMRLGVVVGVLGVYYAALAICAAFVVTFLTVLSMCALASTGDGVAQAGGGLFNALRRSLGHRLGHMVGLMMYVSFGIGAAFYLLGFSELAMVVAGAQSQTSYPLPWNGDASAVTVAVASVILAALMYGVQIRITLRALRLAFVLVMVAVACNVLFLSVPNASTRTGMSMRRFKDNSAEHSPKMFRQMFSTFFPGFCGVIAGANLAEYVSERTASRAPSAVVRKASQYFLLGIHKALAFSFMVYLGLGFVLAACVDNKVLEREPFVVPLVVDSVLGVPLIFLGVASTTLSSALSNIKGASTIFATLYAQSSQPAASPLNSTTKQENLSIIDANETLQSRRSFPTEQRPSVLALASTWIMCQLALLCGSVDTIISVFVDELRVSDHNGKSSLHRQDAVAEQILADEATTPLGSSSPGPPRSLSRKREVDAKRVELAALYVRDAIHGRFLGEEYLVDGLNRMHYKQLFHGLWYIRTANMCVLMALAFFEAPSWCFFLPSCGDRSKVLTWGLPVLPQNVSIAIELVCLTFLAMELSMKYKYMGSRVYFVDKWHILQIVFVLADFVAVLTVLIIPEDPSLGFFHDGESAAGGLEPNASKPIVLAPLIRPIIMVTMSHRLRAGFSSLLRAVPRFADGIVTLVFLVVLYAVLGMVLFAGTAEADAYFASFEDACMSLIILLTTANFPDVMMPIYSQARVYSLFFISFLMIGQLLVMNLVFASIYQHYRQEIAERAVDYSTKRKLALQAAFHLLPTEQVIFEEDEIYDVGQLKTVSRRTYNRLVNRLMRPTLSLFHDDEHPPSANTFNTLEDTSNAPITFEEFVVLIKAFIVREKASAKFLCELRQPSSYAVVRAVQRFVARGWFDRGVDVIILVNLVAILVEIQAKIKGEVAISLSWERLMPMFSIVYIIEMMLKIYVFRSGGYFSSPKNIYDCTVTLVIFVAEASVHTHSIEIEWQWIRLLLLLRFLRCLRLLVALQALSSMFAIVIRLIPAFMTLYGTMNVLPTLGKHLSGTDINDNFLLLFTVTTKWSRIFFVSFYVVGVVMVLSLVVAFVVEAYFEDAARLESASNSNFGDNNCEHISDTVNNTNHEPCDSNERAQRLLRTRSSAFRMRPRADSIYVEEFL
ncbi:unnamed protein product [Phytophthora fragariaefolia]|uniref:Unnamed protein product n=1 Tax=Phytophthora fragariaefolia TaxID=1490495 RepID=A0A9W6XFT5_9STRA|nr:unnamed protein product [Phytophthora fragariaefolia]